jgi:hypothetical protein
MPGFLSSAALHRQSAAADGVPDGAAACPTSAWTLQGLTRAESGTLNPPLVTYTETIGAGNHWTYNNGGTALGPNVRTRFYLRAGTRRYVVIVPTVSTRWVAVTVDTVGWTLTHQATSSATINSATLSDLGNGDRLVDINSSHGLTEFNRSSFHGSLASNTSNQILSYTGDGSTIIIRRLDVEAV